MIELNFVHLMTRVDDALKQKLYKTHIPIILNICITYLFTKNIITTENK